MRERSLHKFNWCSVLGQSHVDSLDRAVLSETIFTQLSANTALLEATEWSLRRELIVGVDPHSTSSEAVSSGEDLRDVLSYNSCSKSIIGMVSTSDGLVKIRVLQNGHNRSKDLLLCNGHVVCNVGKNSWLNKVTTVKGLVTSSDNCGSLVFTLLDVVEDLPD